MNNSVDKLNEQIKGIFQNVGLESISDAMNVLGIEGIIKGFTPTIPGEMVFGPIYTVKFEKCDIPEKCIAGDYIDDVPAGSIVVIDNDNWDYCTVWGNILASVAQKRKIAGTVINGAARDFEVMKKIGYPLYSKHIGCRTGKGNVILKSVQTALTIDGIDVMPNDYIVAQNGIALIIPKEKLENVVEKAIEINEMENKILHAVLYEEMSLREARKKYRYNEVK